MIRGIREGRVPEEGVDEEGGDGENTDNLGNVTPQVLAVLTGEHTPTTDMAIVASVRLEL